MSSITEIVNNIYPLSESTQLEFVSSFETQLFGKGDLIVKEAKRNVTEFIVIKGICRSYVLSPEGKEISLSFFMEGEPVSPNLIRTNNEISILNIQALTDVEVVSFTTKHLMNLMTSNNEFRQWANRVLQRELMQKVEKELGQASLTVEERLLAFREKYDGLENLIAHTHIASYLGITTISLSRLRKRLAGK